MDRDPQNERLLINWHGLQDTIAEYRLSFKKKNNSITSKSNKNKAQKQKTFILVKIIA